MTYPEVSVSPQKPEKPNPHLEFERILGTYGGEFIQLAAALIDTEWKSSWHWPKDGHGYIDLSESTYRIMLKQSHDRLTGELQRCYRLSRFIATLEQRLEGYSQ